MRWTREHEEEEGNLLKVGNVIKSIVQGRVWLGENEENGLSRQQKALINADDDVRIKWQTCVVTYAVRPLFVELPFLC